MSPIIIIVALVLVGIIAYFVIRAQREKKTAAKQKSVEAHPSSTFITGTARNVLIEHTDVTPAEPKKPKSPRIQNVSLDSPKEARQKREASSRAADEEATAARRENIRVERELREEESRARRRRHEEQDEYDRNALGQAAIYNASMNSVFWPGVFPGAMDNDHNHREDSSSQPVEQSSNDTSSSETYTGIPSYGSSDNSSSYSSSSDSGSSYSSDSGSSSGGSDW